MPRNALRRAIADVLLTFADWPQYQSEVANAERATALNRLRAEADAVCEWTLDDSPDDDLWHSGCGEEWIFNAGGPIENKCSFCHQCGRPVVIIDTAARRAEEPRHD